MENLWLKDESWKEFQSFLAFLQRVKLSRLPTFIRLSSINPPRTKKFFFFKFWSNFSVCCSLRPIKMESEKKHLLINRKYAFLVRTDLTIWYLQGWCHKIFYLLKLWPVFLHRAHVKKYSFPCMIYRKTDIQTFMYRHTYAVGAECLCRCRWKVRYLRPLDH